MVDTCQDHGLLPDGLSPPEAEGGGVDLLLLNLDWIQMLTTSELRGLATDGY